MKLTKIEPKFIEKHNPRIGLITLASDFRIEKDFNNIIYGKDVDLFFHAQEHRYTIPQISKILNDFDFEFLGFFSLHPSIKQKFSDHFPKDKKNISLENWHEFELNNPDTFLGMYQFWLKKK